MAETETTAKPGGSRVLNAWISSRDGAAARADVVALAENSSESGTTVNELANLLGAAFRSSAGVAVSKDTAMRVSTVYACVSLIAGAIASLPLGIFQRDGNDRRAAEDHEYWWIFNEKTWDGWTSFAFWQYLISSKLFYGDGFARLVRPSPNSNRVIGMEPFHPNSVDPFRWKGEVLYNCTSLDGLRNFTLRSEDMLHLPSLGFDGLRSPSPITYAGREAIGAAIAAQDYTGRFFSSGANFDYALKTASRLSEKQLTDLKSSLLARAQNNGRGPLILSGGLEPAQLSINSKDAEILATRLFTVEEVCRILGVPPHMAGHTTKSTSFGTGIEQQGIGFVRYTLQNHLSPLAQEVNCKFWPVRQKYFAEHIVAALERADQKSRFEAYRVAMGRAGEQPWMDADEVRRLENMAPNPRLKLNSGTPGKENDEPPKAPPAAE